MTIAIKINRAPIAEAIEALTLAAALKPDAVVTVTFVTARTTATATTAANGLVCDDCGWATDADASGAVQSITMHVGRKHTRKPTQAERTPRRIDTQAGVA